MFWLNMVLLFALPDGVRDGGDAPSKGPPRPAGRGTLREGVRDATSGS